MKARLIHSVIFTGLVAAGAESTSLAHDLRSHARQVHRASASSGHHRAGTHQANGQ